MSTQLKYLSSLKIDTEKLIMFHHADEENNNNLNVNVQKIKEVVPIRQIIHVSPIDEDVHVLRIMGDDFRVSEELKLNGCVSEVEALSDTLLVVCINKIEISLIKINHEKLEIIKTFTTNNSQLINSIKKLNNNSFVTVTDSEICVWNFE